MFQFLSFIAESLRGRDDEKHLIRPWSQGFHFITTESIDLK